VGKHESSRTGESEEDHPDGYLVTVLAAGLGGAVFALPLVCCPLGAVPRRFAVGGVRGALPLLRRGCPFRLPQAVFAGSRRPFRGGVPSVRGGLRGAPVSPSFCRSNPVSGRPVLRCLAGSHRGGFPHPSHAPRRPCSALGGVAGSPGRLGQLAVVHGTFPYHLAAAALPPVRLAAARPPPFGRPLHSRRP
jgi:hypothetical protein